MGHKVTVKRIDWDGLAEELEGIEKPQASNQKSRKFGIIVSAFIVVLLIGTSLGIMISATTPSIPTVIEPGSMMSGYSYVISKDGTTFYAKNGTTGAIDFSNADAWTVITDAVAGSPGGAVFLKDGTYLLSQVLDLSHKRISLFGESALNTVLQRAGDVLVINYTQGPVGFARWSGLTLGNIRIDGVSTTGIGVNLTYGNSETISGINIINCNVGMRLRGVIGCTITDVIVVDCTTGMLWEETEAGWENNDNRMYGGYLGDCEFAIVLSNGTKGNTFYSVCFEQSLTRDLVSRSYAAVPAPQRTQFIGCYFESTDAHHTAVSFESFAGGRTPGEATFQDCIFQSIQFPINITGNHNTVSGCDFVYGGWPPGGYINITGENNTFINNMGWTYPDGGESLIWVKDNGKNNTFIGNNFYTTKQNGVAYIVASTAVTFTHGLGYARYYAFAGADANLTPTIVLASFNNTLYGAWTWTATGTQVTITVQNSGDYIVYWSAEMKN